MMKKKRQYLSLLTAISISFCASGLTGAPSAASLSFSAFDRIEAEDFSSMSGVEIEQLTGGGADVGYIQDGDYLTAGVWTGIVILIAFFFIVLMNVISSKAIKGGRRW